MNVLVTRKRSALDDDRDAYTPDELAARYDADELQRLQDSHRTLYETLQAFGHEQIVQDYREDA